jgi:hypothetical protein
VKVASILDHLRSDGIRGFAYDVQALAELLADRRRLGASSRRAGSGSSISDDGEFPRFCELAQDDVDVFARFRRSAIYMTILEHVTREEGGVYLRELLADPWMFDRLRPLLGSHDVGGPRVYHYPGIGTASPTTLRYIKVAADLHRLFGNLEGLRVAEIGVGYGGQARALTTAWALGRYELYDLPPILGLARRFLDAAGVDASSFGFHDGRSPEPVESDLVISNYALSEVRREVQDAYLENVVLRAPRGYLTYNHISPPELRSYTADEVVAKIEGAHIMPEVPLTDPRNVIIVWGDRERPTVA